MTAPVGWLAERFGRKPLYVSCILGFTVTSMLCGRCPIRWARSWCSACIQAATFGAALVPLSQAHPARHLPTRATRFRHGDLERRRHAGPHHGPDGRRLADRKLQLALGVLAIQSAVLAWLAAAGLMIFPAEQRRPGKTALRLAWLRRADNRDRRHAIDARSRLRTRTGSPLMRSSPRRCSPALVFICSWSMLAGAREPLILAGGVRGHQLTSGPAADVRSRRPDVVSSLALMTPWLQVFEQLSGGDRRADHGATRVRQPWSSTILGGRAVRGRSTARLLVEAGWCCSPIRFG